MQTYMLITLLSLLALMMGLAGNAEAPAYDDWFTESTLRLDYVFAGDASRQQIFFMEAFRGGVWAGRRSHLDEALLRGNGEIRILAPEDGKTLYVNSFSTLFQEWVGYEEATQLSRGFENCFLVPFPKAPVQVEVRLWDSHGKETACLRHKVNPADILIRQMGETGNETRTLHDGGQLPKAVDVAVVSDGYTAEQRDKFFADAARLRDAILSHDPFASREGQFNFRAVFVPSEESGPSIPHEGHWVQNALGSHFDTFYSQRYLTTSRMRKVYDALGTVPFEQIVVLVNTPVYGGGGIYNSVTIMGSDHATFNEVIVHEFGHAFGGLADEYYYDDMYESPYPLSVEPWEPNITTLVDFGSKWADMLAPGTPVPTQVDDPKADFRKIWSTLSAEQKAELNTRLGVFEGGGYTSHGVYRPVRECRMKINECELFCPVCTRALERMIDFLTK